MTTKAQRIAELSASTSQAVVQHPDRWMAFLRTAAWNYKYPFQDQLLIFAQRPNATACATIEVWNKRLNRWVKRGAKGIALIEDRGNHFGLRHVFDVSDTQSRDQRPVALWSMQDSDIEPVIETLENAFGELGQGADLPIALIAAAQNAVDDNSADYVAALLRERDNSLLEELEPFHVEALFKEAAKNAVAFMVMTRCGLEASHYVSREDFSGVGYFNTLLTLSHLGAAVSDIAEMMLREIESTIRALRREAQRAAPEPIRTVAQADAMPHNEGKQPERMDEHDERTTDVYAARGLPFPQSGDGRDRAVDWEVRHASQDVSANAAEGLVREPDAVGRDALSSDGDRSDGESAGRADDTEAAGGSPRAGQSGRPDRLGRTPEQSEAASGGARSDEADLHLKWYDRRTEDNSLPFFHDRAIINDMLRTAPLLASKANIEAYFLAKEDGQELALYVRSLFPQGVTELTVDGDHRVGLEPYQNVLHLWEGAADSKTAQGFYDWGVIAQHIASMILLNEFDSARLREPSIEQQALWMDQAEDDKSSAFAIPQEAIDAILQRGSGFENSKLRIALHFQEQLSVQENADFLKQEYGTGGRLPALIGTDIYEQHDSRGIHITRGSIMKPDAQSLLPWMKVQKRIGELLAAERYLNRQETERLPAFAQEQEERRRQRAEEVRFRELAQGESTLERTSATDLPAPPEPTSAAKPETIDRTRARYAYAEGDTVYYGADEHNILLANASVVILQDAQFPLFTKEMTRRDFERMLRENPLNDHLLTGERETDGMTDGESSGEQERDWEHAYADAEFTPAPSSNTVSDLEMDKDELDASEGDEIGMHAEGRTRPSDALAAETDLNGSASSLSAHSPAVPKQEAQREPLVNYRITDNRLGHGGAKTKFAHNVSAIRLLKQIEREERPATADEQAILARYVGWGGIPQAFDENNAQWNAEYDELKALLEPEEYESARASTLNAHYTSPTVIKAIYTCLENIGFRNGNILEPSCGTGNFFGLLPESFKDSRLFGIELDGITGRIAKRLYPKASIAVSGYEQTSLPDSFFDLAIGNVPFGGYGVADKKYDKHKFLIHDYFFAKTLDKVRPGGIIAFITSKGTMDKQNPTIRQYIAQRAELLGAVRLPNNAFFANAGTEVTSDILFLQKRDRMVTAANEEWIHLSATEDGVPINAYFAAHPDMVLGMMAYDDRMYGNKQETTCQPHPDADLAEQLQEALENIHAEWTDIEREELPGGEETATLPADPNVRNFSFTLVGGHIYYRENSRMHRIDTSATAKGRIKGLIALRSIVRDLIDYQTDDYSDEVIREQQSKLNREYDRFTAQYGLINSRANSLAFADDSAYFLLCSLEVLDEEGRLHRKADMFTKRTIRQRTSVNHVDTAADALTVSIGEKARVDLTYMAQLTGFSEDKLIRDLQGVIFPNPEKQDENDQLMYETADAYLSGHVRDKLRVARQFAARNPDLYGGNVKALEAVQPQDLAASEIDVRLGATWLPPAVIKEFIFELVDTPYMFRQSIDVLYSDYTAAWNIRGKSDDRSGNIKANVTYGTNRINAYKILEETLNLRDVRIFDTVYEDGVEKRVLNKKETAIAQQKQEAMKDTFRDWIWKDPQRRERLIRLYNDRFNAIRPREYDGSHIRFAGMNPEIRLRQHQINAVARVLYGGNSLFAHCVGAGKTFAMTAAAMESKQLGLCNKSLFVVPNHLTEQWAAEFLQLYPSANVLVATKKDFETKRRKTFCARIATGDYDAIIIGHSQFEKIPLSTDRQREQLSEQIAEITNGIRELKEARGERYAIKQLEKTRKTLKLKLEKLNDASRKDDVVTFEELGIDRLYVDEADSYKNLFLYTKMRNVAGLAQTEAQKSSDMFAKCRYLDELTGGRGIIFATGTPISNSITEMYVRP